MLDVSKKILVIFSISLVLLLTAESVCASGDVLDNSSLEISDADVEIDSNALFSSDEKTLEGTDYENGSDVPVKESSGDVLNSSDEGSNSSGQVIGSSGDNSQVIKGTYHSTVVNFYSLTKEYTSGDIFYSVRAYDVVSYAGIKYVQPKYNSLVKLCIFTSNGYEYYYGRIGNDGVASIGLSDLAIGTHKIRIYVDGAYKGASSVKVIKANTKIYAPVQYIKYDKNKYYKIKVVDSSNNFAKGVLLNVRVFTGNTYVTYYVKTNSNGVASLKTDGLSLGIHSVVVSTLDQRYKISKSTVIYMTSSVPKKAEQLEAYAPAKVVKYGGESYFTVEVRNSYANVVKNLQLKVTVFNGKKYKTFSIKTNSKGVASLKTNKLSLGTHKVTVKSDNKNYILNKNSKIIVSKSVVSDKVEATKLLSLQFCKKDDGLSYAKLVWNSEKNVKYQILRKSGGDFAVIATVRADCDNMVYCDRIVGQKNPSYTYSVRQIIEKANNVKILGPYDEDGLKLLNCPDVTVDFQNLRAVVKWDKVGDATNYIVYRKVGRDGKFESIATVDASKSCYVDYYYKSASELSSMMVGNAFIIPSVNDLFYTVRACNFKTVDGVSKKSYGSYLLDGDFHLEAPAIISLQNSTISWYKSPNAQGYLILKRQSDSDEWQVICDVSPLKKNVQSVKIGKIDNNAYYSVQAYADKNGVRVYSAYDRGFSLCNCSEESSSYSILYIGDSITKGAHCYSLSVMYNFSIPQRVAQLLGGVYYNPSIGGSTYHECSQNLENDSYYCIARNVVDPISTGERPIGWEIMGNEKNSEGKVNTSIDEYDIVVLSAGTNDYFHNAQLGDLYCDDISTFNGALNHIIGKIAAASEKRINRGESPIKLVFIDLFYSDRGYDSIRSNRDETPNEICLTLTDYQNALDLQYDKWQYCPYLTLYNFNTRDYGIVSQENCPYNTADNLHFAYYIYGQYGNAFANFLLENVFD